MLIIKHTPDQVHTRRRITAKRDKALLHKTFLWNNKIEVSTADHCHLARKCQRALYALITGNDDTFYWRDVNNKVISFTPLEFMEFMHDYDKFYEQIHIDSWKEKAALVDDHILPELL